MEGYTVSGGGGGERKKVPKRKRSFIVWGGKREGRNGQQSNGVATRMSRRKSGMGGCVSAAHTHRHRHRLLTTIAWNVIIAKREKSLERLS